jgi:hypothetical protein
MSSSLGLNICILPVSKNPLADLNARINTQNP